MLFVDHIIKIIKTMLVKLLEFWMNEIQVCSFKGLQEKLSIVFMIAFYMPLNASKKVWSWKDDTGTKHIFIENQ